MEEKGDGTELVLCQNNVIPFGVQRHLDFIDLSEEGCLLLGSSNLTGKYWNGCIFYYKDPDLAPSNDKWSAGHNCESGVTSGKFLDSEEKVIVGEDNGSLTVFNIVSVESGDLHFVPVIMAAHHDGAITSIDVTRPGDYVISGGDDMCINVWERESMCSIHRWYPAHSRCVTSVAASPGSPHIFASCSLDGVALIWDTRMSKPANVLDEGGGFGLTGVCWSPRVEGVVFLGDKRGTVKVVDGRTPQPTHLASIRALDRSIHSLTADWSQCNSGLVAICGDTPTLVIWDPTTNRIVYKDNKSHTGMIRGLAWSPKDGSLYSCGFDTKVTHHLPPSEPVTSPL